MANPNDPFDAISPQSLRDPPDEIYVITPSDGNTLSPAVRSLRCAGAGNIQVTRPGAGARLRGRRDPLRPVRPGVGA